MNVIHECAVVEQHRVKFSFKDNGSGYKRQSTSIFSTAEDYTGGWQHCVQFLKPQCKQEAILGRIHSVTVVIEGLKVKS